jgi:septum formation protein
MKIILASGSPTRKDMLTKMGMQFTVVKPDCEEKVENSQTMESQVKRLAKEKTASVYNKFSQEKDVLILGFDSLVEVDNQILGKPKTKKEAFEMFQKFVGKKVGTFTGMTVAGNVNGKYVEKTIVEKSWLVFRSDITNCQIRLFLDFDQWQGKAGGITIEGIGAFLLADIEGDYQNVLGIPVIKMGEVIRELTGKSPLKVFTK